MHQAIATRIDSLGWIKYFGEQEEVFQTVSSVHWKLVNNNLTTVVNEIIQAFPILLSRLVLCYTISRTHTACMCVTFALN
jgi:hypothetical protein